MLRWMAASTSELISRSLVFSCSNSSTKWRTALLYPSSGPDASPEAAGDVVFRFFLGGRFEDNGGAVEFDQAPQQEEAGVIGHARGLLHVVGHNHDGAAIFKLENEILDFRRG